MTSAPEDFRIDLVIAARLRAYRSEKRRSRLDPNAPPLLYGLDLPARIDCMSAVSAFVAEAARRRGLDAPNGGLIELAVYEACINVIEHGYKFDASRRFRLDLLEEEDRLTFQIVSGGEPLDPRRLNDKPAAPAPAMHHNGRGLGLQIILRAMDDVFCEREDGGTNRLVLVKRLRETALSS
jgi:serine/threonine-protein kinase RsbW